MKFNPCGHFIVVELNDVPTEEKSAGGIILSKHGDKNKSEQKGMCLATVADVGPNCWAGFTDYEGQWEAWCKTGDQIMIAQYAGQSFPIPDSATTGEKELLGRMRLIKDDDVLARLSND